ncbi:MAG: hypothetical protein ACFFAS_17025 [Promethearchaeota archaeon]
MELINKRDLKEELLSKDKLIDEQNRIIEILRESNALIKKVNQKIIAEKDNEIEILKKKISQLQEEIKKTISLSV